MSMRPNCCFVRSAIAARSARLVTSVAITIALRPSACTSPAVFSAVVLSSSAMARAAGVRVMGRDPAERALALESLRRWPELDRELEGETGYRRDGGLRVAIDEAAWTAVRAWVDEQRAFGVPVEVVAERAMRGLA